MSDDTEHEAAPSSGGPVRVFVGIGLLSEIADRLVRIASVLERPDVRLVHANDMHLTLLPPWQETSIPRAVETLRRIAAGVGAFALDIQHVGYAPDLRRPRMLWANCVSTDELAALRAALLAAYTQTDERPFRPHVTLARLSGNG